MRPIKTALDILDMVPENRIFIIPVRIDLCEPSHSRLLDLHWVDLFADFSSGLEKIISSIITNENKKGISPEKTKDDFDVLLDWAQEYIFLRSYERAYSVLAQCINHGTDSQKLVALPLLEKVKNYIKTELINIVVGDVYRGRVDSVHPFGAFITISPGIAGLVHISEVKDEKVENINSHIKAGDFVLVKVEKIDVDKKRIQLSMKNVDESDPWKYG